MRMALIAGTHCLALQLFAFASTASHSTAAHAFQPSDASTRPETVRRTNPPLPQQKPARSLSSLRARLDHTDQLIAMRALHMALSQVPDGGTFVWRKRSRSLKGLIKPTKAFRNAQGQVCRHLIYALSLGRYMKQIEGIACRGADGRWQL